MGEDRTSKDVTSCSSCSVSGDRRFRPRLLDNGIRRLFSPPKKLVEEFAKEGQTVADLGSGSGFYSIPFAKKVGANGRVYAVDFDERAIARLEKRASRLGLGGTIVWHAGSATNLSFIPDASVDSVIANGLLCCMVDHAGALSELKRILKPEGFAYLSVTSLGRKKDPRLVGKEEWEEVLSGFRVIWRKKGLATRSARVAKHETLSQSL